MMKRILLCVCGGIAAYKAIDLASLLVRHGYEVKSILTQGALEFVSGLNFSALTNNSVHTNLFQDSDPIPHIRLAEWADLIVVAPATANIIAKAANGFSDDLLSATLLANLKPVVFVPAMNVYMFENAATQTNLQVLENRGHFIMPPETGRLACGYVGKGKYPPNPEILAAIETNLAHGRDLKGKKVLVTAGATIEAIDPMRYISNRSSGKMGLALARALALRGAKVTLVHANLNLPIPHYLHETSAVESAAEMNKTVLERADKVDWIIKCAAVADYAPQKVSKTKLPKDKELLLYLKQTPDILAQLGKHKKTGQLLVGFAAQSEDDHAKALDKLKRKNLDMICQNNIRVAGMDNSVITLIRKAIPDEPIHLSGNKFELAHRLIDVVNTL